MKNGIPFNLVNYIENEIKDFVTQAEFAPVRAIAFGLVSLILLAVAGAILKLIFIK